MNSVTTRCFRELFAKLPADIQRRTREAYKQFVRNPNHPGLHFKKVHSRILIYSARVTDDYRVLGIQENNTIAWFWVGKHSVYEKLLKNF